jgi:hypothetical protein
MNMSLLNQAFVKGLGMHIMHYKSGLGHLKLTNRSSSSNHYKTTNGGGGGFLSSYFKEKNYLKKFARFYIKF